MWSVRVVSCSISRGLLQPSRWYHDIRKLESSINKQIFDYDKRVVDEQVVMSSIKSLINYQQTSDSEEKKEVINLFTKVVESSNVELSNELLLKVVKELNPPTELIVKLFEAYNSRYPTSYINQDVASIALRKCLYGNVNLNHALRIVDLSSGSSNHLDHLRSQRNLNLLKYFTGGFAGIGVLDFALRAFSMNPSIGVYAMCFTYVFNVIAFGFLSFGDRFIPIVDHIEFKSGSSTNERYLHSDELKMLSKVAEVDISLNGLEGFVSQNFAQSISSKNMIPMQPESDLLIQEYWLTGGNNFEWIEPDQDPAEILWRERVEQQKPILLNDIQWTDRLIEGEITQGQLKEA